MRVAPASPCLHANLHERKDRRCFSLPLSQKEEHTKSQHTERERERERETYAHVVATAIELSVHLAEGAGLAAAVDEAVGAGLLPQPELRPQFGAVEAGVQALAARHIHYKRVQRPTRPACFTDTDQRLRRSILHAVKSQTTKKNGGSNDSKKKQYSQVAPLSTISAI